MSTQNENQNIQTILGKNMFFYQNKTIKVKEGNIDEEELKELAENNQDGVIKNEQYTIIIFTSAFPEWVGWFNQDIQNINISALAKFMNVARSTIYKWASGEHFPLGPDMFKLASVISKKRGEDNLKILSEMYNIFNH